MPPVPLEARAFAAHNSYPYHKKSPNFSLIISRLDVTYNSSIIYLVRVLEVKVLATRLHIYEIVLLSSNYYSRYCVYVHDMIINGVRRTKAVIFILFRKQRK